MNLEMARMTSAGTGEALRGRLAVLAPGGLEAGSEVEFMVMPGGTHTCWFGQGERAVRRAVLVDRAAADALNEQLAAVNGRGQQRAYFDFDHQETGPASGWPIEFCWRQKEGKDGADRSGVYCRAGLSEAGAAAIRGRNYRAFSPVFYVSAGDPARVICREDAALCMGSFVNAPAFHEIEPLWAREAKAEGGGLEPEGTISATPVAVTTEINQRRSTERPLQTKGQTSMAEQAETAAANSAQAAEDALKARDNTITSLEGELEALKAKDAQRRKKDAEAGVAAAVKRGTLPGQDEALKARWTRLIEEDADNLALLAGLPDNLALTGSVTRGAEVRSPGWRRQEACATERLEASEGPSRVLRAYSALVGRNAGVQDLTFAGFRQKGELARDMGVIFAREIAPRWNEFRDMPLRAADATDANLGTLSGTLVAQRTLELFKLSFPAISRIHTDFSEMPAQFRQTEATRIVVTPSVQSYNATADATGRPQGWSTVSAAQTKDVLITLDEHIGVPIVFDANTLASTIRRLFDEQAPAASYALAKYFVEKIYKLFTLANYNAYAAKNGAKVPNVYAKYPVAIGDFARSTLTRLAAIFNPNEVPINDRFVLLASDYFEQLATDPSLVTFFAGQRSPEILTESRLPKLAGFEPIEAPNLAAPGVTPNLAGMALHKAAVIAKTRLSNDYTQALPGASYGSVTTVTEPDLGISVVLVQYVNHTGVTRSGASRSCWGRRWETTGAVCA